MFECDFVHDDRQWNVDENRTEASKSQAGTTASNLGNLLGMTGMLLQFNHGFNHGYSSSHP